MAKLSGLIDSGKIGQADQKTIDAMPNAPMPDANKRKNQPQSGSQAYGSPCGDVLNLDIATNKALKLFLEFLNENVKTIEREG